MLSVVFGGAGEIILFTNAKTVPSLYFIMLILTYQGESTEVYVVNNASKVSCLVV